MITALAQPTLLCHPIHYAYYFTYKTTKIITQNWLQFFFFVKAAALKQQISKFCPHIQRTEAIAITSFQSAVCHKL